MNRIFYTLMTCLLLSIGSFTALAQSYPASSYSLSSDGKTLMKWKGSEAIVNLATDAVLSEVKTIGKGAFAENSTLKEFYSGNVELIKGGMNDYEGAFESCKALQKVELATVLEIEDGAFFFCSEIQTLIAPKLQKIGVGCFAACPKLASFEAPELQDVGANAITATNLKELVLPKIETLGATCL